MAETQQSWAFKVGDGADPEVFTQLEGMYSLPDFIPNNVTTRDGTTIDIASSSTTKKRKFNRMKEGAELSITVDLDPAATAQAILLGLEGDDDGCNVEVEYVSGAETPVTHTWTFNVIVGAITYQFADSNDENAVDQVTFPLMINSTPAKVVV